MWLGAHRIWKEASCKGINMEISGLSDKALHCLWTAVKNAFIAYENALASGDSPGFGVRETPDWKEWSDSLEREMQKREISFEPISWWPYNPI